jgi:hypothetical protein
MSDRTPTVRGRLGLVALVLFVAAAGAACTPPAGTLMHPPRMGPVDHRLSVTLSVAPVVDRRPAIEHEGSSPSLRFIIPLVFYWHWQSRGSYVTNDHLASPAAPMELTQLLQGYLSATGAFGGVTVGGPADFVLETEIVHLYASAYQASEVIVAGGGSSSSASSSASVSQRSFAPYGNAVVLFKLWDTRGGNRRLVWSRHVRGNAQGRPGPPVVIQRQMSPVVREATADLLQKGTYHVVRAVERAARAGESIETHARRFATELAQGKLVFIIARVDRLREKTELVALLAPSGTIAGPAAVAPNYVPPISRPGDWVLSRLRADGTIMSTAEYQALARTLAPHFELRRVDDVVNYHYFGPRRGAVGAVLPALVAPSATR